MKNLTFTVPNNLNLLHDELIASVPELRPVQGSDSTGDFVPRMGVQGHGDEIFLSVPDDADLPAIEAVIRRHDASKSQPDLEAAARASGRKKLVALGLTEAEIRAIISG
jgi:hypothetical protein